MTSAEKLRELVSREIPEGELVVISNRAPDARAASGLVTAIDPMLRACGGTWIAYGSGGTDRGPDYTLRRLWIEEEEYERYYSGFANEGLWPLCHMAHAQPMFRAQDWHAYERVNQTFADAAPDDGLVLIQDYHFALAPRMLRNRAPHLVSNLFWHIPWPHAEVIGICPWKEALLEGMLGADVVGFHTTQYCLNFLDAAQRYLECRVDAEERSVTYRGHTTLVRAYPISVEWPYPAAAPDRGDALRRALGIPSNVHVSLGVDRADYTKGLVERIAAVELLLEQNPSLLGRYVLVQLASPSRTRIPRYQQLLSELREIADRVNRRFGTERWQPVRLQLRTFSPEEVREHYRLADSVLVTPLHDGMNLVAKEYAAACDDGDGVLVLSTFAGAAKELDGALLVNPYDTQQTADAILRAIHMPLAERRARMQVMREQIASHSIYDWSEAMLTDLCDLRRQRSRFWPQRIPVEDRQSCLSSSHEALQAAV